MNKNYIIVWLVLTTGALLLLTKCADQEKNMILKGQKPPEISLSDQHGKTVSLSDFQGQAVLLRFWTLDCVSCAKEMPELDELYRQYKDKGFAILAINVRQSPDAVKRFINEHKLTYHVLFDMNADVYKDYNIVGFPTSYIIDRQGKSQEKIFGEIDKDALEALIVKFL
jgi:peroxiredoxin